MSGRWFQFKCRIGSDLEDGLIELEERKPGVRVTRHLVPELHHPESGRLDAKRVSALYGLPLASLARILDRSLSSVHKTPDSPAIQPELAPFERIAAAFAQLVGSAGQLRAWINAAHPDLGGRTPLSVIEEGRAGLVAELLEDALMGQPG